MQEVISHRIPHPRMESHLYGVDPRRFNRRKGDRAGVVSLNDGVHQQRGGNQVNLFSIQRASQEVKAADTDTLYVFDAEFSDLIEESVRATIRSALP